MAIIVKFNIVNKIMIIINNRAVICRSLVGSFRLIPGQANAGFSLAGRCRNVDGTD